MPQKIRYAVVGLGHIAQVAMLPAFKNAKNSELSALVSGDPQKLKRLGRKYGVEAQYTYDQFEACLASGEIDAVYLALPNSMHREYTERAAALGVHVLCEKPMGLDSSECEAMIRSTVRNGVKLMVAYRLHFQRPNLKAIEVAQSGKLGDLRVFNSTFSMQVKDQENIRLKKKLGGGTLFDIGIYCINASRSLFESEPIEVMAIAANNGQARFSEVDEMTGAIMRFPEDRLATFTSSFGAADEGFYEIVGTKGKLKLEKAYEYASGSTLAVTVGENTTKTHFKKRDQFGSELVYFSDCILKDNTPQPSGVEGMADVRVIEALLQSAVQSAKTGRAVSLKPFELERRPSMRQEIRRQPVSKPEVIRATAPHT